MSALAEARAKLREQLDWRGPNGRPQGILTLTRAEAEAILAGPTEPVAVLDEIMRLAALIKREDVSDYAASTNECPVCKPGECIRGGDPIRCRRAQVAVDDRAESVLTPKP